MLEGNMSKRTLWLVPWFLALVFAAGGCATHKVAATEPKPPQEHIDEITLEILSRGLVANPTVTVRLRIVIDPHPDNDFVEWSWDSADGESGATGRVLPGERSARVFRPEINLTRGEYRITATVYRGEESFTSSTTITVLGGGSSSP